MEWLSTFMHTFISLSLQWHADVGSVWFGNFEFALLFLPEKKWCSEGSKFRL